MDIVTESELAAMIMMSGGGGVIQPLSVTQNDRYEAPKGVDGFNPVIVNVPDRYDEGFQAGYTEGYNDGREAQKKICDEEKASLIEEIDRQDKEIEELKKKQGYTFPEGTSYEDIYQFVGDDTVTDKTIGYSVRTDITPIEGDTQNANNTKVRIVDSSGNIVDTIAGWDYCPDGKVYSIQISTNGDYIVRTSFLTYSGNSRYLVGFGASGNQINVQSN